MFISDVADTEIETMINIILSHEDDKKLYSF